MAYHYTATLTLPASPLAPLDLDATRRAWVQDARDALAAMTSGIPTSVTWSRGDDDYDEGLSIAFDGRFGDGTKRRYLSRIDRRLRMWQEGAEPLPDVIELSHRRES